jgi:hypothetical protein
MYTATLLRDGTVLVGFWSEQIRAQPGLERRPLSTNQG